MKSSRQPRRKPVRPTVAGGKPRSTAEPITSQLSAMFEANGPDPVVKIASGPATIFVIQKGRVRATIEWPRSQGGTVLIPLKAVAATTDPVFVGVRPGLIPKLESDSLARLMCPRCNSPNPSYPCCP
jgi:hypothetical protein